MGTASTSAERLADHFVFYLFSQYQGTRHVRRVASWIGFIIKAVEKIAGPSLRQNRQRQIMFDYRRRHFKAKYNHQTGPRGGIEIVEVLPGRGSPEGKTVIQVKNLADAEICYLTFKKRIDAFVK